MQTSTVIFIKWSVSYCIKCYKKNWDGGWGLCPPDFVTMMMYPRRTTYKRKILVPGFSRRSHGSVVSGLWCSEHHGRERSGELSYLPHGSKEAERDRRLWGQHVHWTPSNSPLGWEFINGLKLQASYSSHLSKSC
jgi:hypothetical protein